MLGLPVLKMRFMWRFLMPYLGRSFVSYTLEEAVLTAWFLETGAALCLRGFALMSPSAFDFPRVLVMGFLGLRGFGSQRRGVPQMEVPVKSQMS